MRGRLRIESSSESLGMIHQIIKQAMRIQNAYHPQCFDRPVLQFLDLKTHHTDISSTSTIKPVLDCVSASITHKRTSSTRPSHTHRIHPQQNGKSAHIAAAAWLGFAKPNPCRTKSPTTKPTTHQPSAALDDLQHLLGDQNSLRPSLVAHMQSYLLTPHCE